MAKKAGKKKKKNFWKSKEAKRAMLVFGIPVVGLLAWYAYTVTYELNKPEMKEFEKDLAARSAAMAKRMKTLAARAVREGFLTKDVDKCQNMIDLYTTPKGWTFTDESLNQLVGLPKKATEDELQERCIYFAKAVRKMERKSHHQRHVFVCGKSSLELGGGGRYYIRPEPNGRGAIQTVDHTRPRVTDIPPGENMIFSQWQVHNVGDGCIIAGVSKTGIFRMSGQVVHKE